MIQQTPKIFKVQFKLNFVLGELWIEYQAWNIVGMDSYSLELKNMEDDIIVSLLSVSFQ